MSGTRKYYESHAQSSKSKVEDQRGSSSFSLRAIPAMRELQPSRNHCLLSPPLSSFEGGEGVGGARQKAPNHIESVVHAILLPLPAKRGEGRGEGL